MKNLKLGPVVRLRTLGQTPQGSSAQRIIEHANRAIWEHQYHRRLKLVARTAVWPILVAIVGLRCAIRYGRLVKAQTGLGMLEQWAQQWILCIRYHFAPLDYYKFGLYRPERAKMAHGYITHYQGIALIPVLNQQRVKWDKREFAEFCARLNLPHASTVATFEPSQSTSPIAAKELPKADLFVKPSNLGGGNGAERWRWVNGAFEGAENRRLEPNELIARLKVLSRSRPFIVQRRLVNHPDLLPISNGALCTLRMLSGLKKGSTEPVLILATLRMPLGRSIVDNITAGGIAAAVDAVTGRLNEAMSNDLGKQTFAKHPDTGEVIAQRMVPMWTQCVTLVKRAHRCFGPIALVGWDVAVTPEGPVLVEGNFIPCLEGLQMSHGVPLLATAFSDVALSHLEPHTGAPILSGRHATDEARRIGAEQRANAG